MTRFTIDPSRLAAFDRAYGAACAADSAAIRARSETGQQRWSLVNEIERKSSGRISGRIRGQDKDFLEVAVREGFADPDTASRIRRLDAEIARLDADAAVADRHRAALNDTVDAVRRYAKENLA